MALLNAKAGKDTILAKCYSFLLPTMCSLMLEKIYRLGWIYEERRSQILTTPQAVSSKLTFIPILFFCL